MTIETSNKWWIEKLSDEKLCSDIRNYMEETRIPCVFYDLIDEIVDRLSKRNNK